YTLRGFMEDFTLAERHPLDHQFAKYLWGHGMLDPQWTLSIVQTVLSKPAQPDQWASGVEELMRFTLRICTSQAVAESTRNEAMNTFDTLMKQFAGAAN